MTSCDDLEDKPNLSENSCVCCYPPDFSSYKISFDPAQIGPYFGFKVKLIIEYLVTEIKLKRKYKILSDDNVYITLVDPTTKPLKEKDYKICSTCVSRPDLLSKIIDIFYIPMSIYYVENGFQSIE